jgi:cytoskeletal protein CcmA (bactofilin family)
MANTIIGSTIVIDGEVSSSEDLLVHGKIKGRVTVQQDLYVGQSGTVEAEVETGNLEISGRVNGNIVARQKVEIATGGQAVGDVKAQRILIADGAIFKGNVDMGV